MTQTLYTANHYLDFLRQAHSENPREFETVVKNIRGIIKSFDRHVFDDTKKGENGFHIVFNDSPVAYLNTLLCLLKCNDKGFERLAKADPILHDLMDVVPFEFPHYPTAARQLLVSTVKKDLAEKLHAFLHEYSGNKEVRYLNAGGTTCAFQSGDYVAKIGEARWNYELPASELWAQPLIRDIVREKDGTPSFVFELFRRLKPHTFDSGVPKSQINYIVQHANAEGWDWEDDKFSNVGLLMQSDSNQRVIPPGHGGFYELDSAITPPANLRARIIDLDLARLKNPAKQRSTTDRIQ